MEKRRIFKQVKARIRDILPEAQFLLIFIFLFIATSCTNESPGPLSNAFIKYYGINGIDEASIVEETSDGFVLLGSSKRDTIQAVTKQMYVIKTDFNGLKINEKTFGGDHTTEGRALKETPDGGFAFFGNYINDDNTSDLYLVKTDRNLNSKWEIKIPLAKSNEQGYAFTILPNGNYFLLGTTSLDEGPNDMVTVTVSPEGGMLKEPVVQGIQSRNDNVGKSIVLRPNGRLAWCGTQFRDLTGNDPGTSNIRLIFSTEDGISDGGDFDFGGKRNDIAADIQKASTGYVVVGTSDGLTGEGSKIYLVKTNENGSLQWSKLIGGNNPEYPSIIGNQKGSSIYPTKDGGYIIVGTTDVALFQNQEGQNIYLVKTNSTGEVEWEEVFGGRGNELASTVRQTSDGGYIIAATVDLNGDPTMCLIKTNSKGKVKN